MQLAFRFAKSDFLRWVLILICLLILGFITANRAHFSDFPAFYCGGLLQREHLHPHELASLAACERQIHIGSLYGAHLFDDPVRMPYPSYILQLFSLMTYFSPGVALCSWIATGVLASAIVIVVVQNNTNFRPTTLLPLVALPTVSIIITLGHVTTLLALGICLAVIAARKGLDLQASFALLPALLYPQCGVIAYLGLACARPAARIPAFAILSIIGVYSLWLDSLPQIIYYVTYTLREQALANAVGPWQYGVIGLLYDMGISAVHALQLGQCLVVLSLIGTFFWGYNRLRLTGDPAPLIILPVVCVTALYYANMEEYAALVPCLLLLHGHATKKTVIVAQFAIWCPWAITGSIFEFISMPVLALFPYWSESLLTALFTSLSMCILAYQASVFHGIQHFEFLVRNFGFRQEMLDSTLLKIPSWIGFFALFISSYFTRVKPINRSRI